MSTECCQQPDTLINPTLLVEVLAPSTQDDDRGTKFMHYRTINSLREYVVVAQDRCHIEHWVRQPDERWLLVDYIDRDQQIVLDSIRCTLDIALVYAKIELGAALDPLHPPADL